MARPLRIEYDGALYHITARGNNRRPIFRSDADRVLFLDTLNRVNQRFHWICHGYCLMNNHYHLIVETPDGNLSLGMRQLNGVYTQAFNKRHRCVGHVFQGRFKAVLVQKDSHFLEVCRYVVLNPVRAKAVGHPRQWKWSSYNATAGNSSVHPCLSVVEILSYFGSRKGSAQEKYREFVHAGLHGASLWNDLKAHSLLGADGFAERFRPLLADKQEFEDIPRGQRFAARPSLEKLFARSRGKKSRDKTIAQAVILHGYSQIQLARFLKLHYSTISRIVGESANYQV